MKQAFLSSRISLLLFAPVFLVSISCSSPESEFEKTRQTNTIEAYNAFIAKYPDNPLATEAANWRDQLAYESAIADTSDSSASFSVDSLASLKENALENLVANAELAEKTAEDREEANEAVEDLAKAGQVYQLAAKVQELIGENSDEMYKKAAFAYYKAAKKSQAAQMNSFFSAFNDWVKGEGRLSVTELQYRSAAAIAPHHLTKSLLYERSAELFRKAGMEEHADWMMQGGTIKNFSWEELEAEAQPDSLQSVELENN